ncbi:glucose-1-phosphate cytidylyltransferase [Leptospira borgpetersenii]|uniref:Glucose-1-phosphate cytidylyltransferase n=1 Tax=Leptospira borgpetersenii serovar Javanica str. UI 09931 TaxID=1049767 RepID=A0AAV3J8G5_LEPBO|nr:glucose-1-phosphate cytidylyltransferase [Leptospira borgpetersenii]EMN58453.1 glucose-1-phosphate cytidylyltransferase [Leptospira borgpetersenii serovar Javanica str. MK146]EPG56427.1 glucose-1-phosphate cytidylyltransferase [Leptospira borgpetersenii serovar Javanica str. UI 09931]MDQ7244378.1 glucose-1-phosphate cytidylyltransferase [Leptospira borgpetersenii]GIM18546.1 glucose-1-phosphate cytidylyltransferase [Leptospira borgpetersenii]GIM21856.1 glucose-1-phosphate cytidylyltransferas
MKTVILCGGLGTRLSEETTVKPKPMVEIAGKPILWHIMKIYEHYGFGDFVLALGYKGEAIKDYFLNYHARMSDLTISLKSGIVDYSNPTAEDWKVQLIDTGALTMTGGRLLRLKNHLKETFMVTYGDGVSDVDIQKLVSFHKSHGKLATVTAVRPPVRFGELSISGDQVIRFQEKPQAEEGWINGGFFVFEPEILNYIEDESTMLERAPLEKLAKLGQLMSFRHPGYWQCMDTLRDKQTLEELWLQNKAPWKLGKNV